MRKEEKVKRAYCFRKFLGRRKVNVAMILALCIMTSVVSVAAVELLPIDATHAHGNAVKISDINDFDNGKVSAANYYGGSNQIDVATTNVEVTNEIKSGLGQIYAGGNNKNATESKLTINGPWLAEWAEDTSNAISSGQWMFGGGIGNNANTGNANLIMNSGLIPGYIIGGGNNGAVTGHTNIVVNGGQVGRTGKDVTGQGEIYGGGVNRSKVTGNTNITINGGIIQQHIVGGGLGSGADVLGSTNITINGGSLKGTVAGGGGNKDNIIFGDTNITINKGDTNTDGGANGRIVTGGGYWTCNHVKGNANILFNLKENDTFKATIYGSGGIRRGSTSANEVGGVNIKLLSGTLIGNVFGGGKLGTVLGQTSILLDGANVIGSIYGGSHLGGYTNHIDIQLKNGTVSDNVFGIGASANVEKTSNLAESIIHIHPDAHVDGKIVASNPGTKVINGKESRVIFHDMDSQEGFLTTFAGKEIETGTSADTAMEFNNFTANNTTTIANTKSRFSKIDFTNNTNMYLTNVVNQYFGNYWTIDTSSRVYINEAQTIDAVDVLNKGTIALLKGDEGKEFKELTLTGTYTGEDGNLEVSSKAVGSTDYVNIAGVATGNTTLNVDLSDGTWDGNDLDLVEADMSESDANAFTMEPFACVLDKDGKAVQAMAKLLTRTDEETGRRYWYLSYTEAPEVSLQGTKEIKGIDSTKEEFTFEAVQVDEQGTVVVVGATPQRMTRKGAGEFKLAFGQYNEGTYYFSVKEVAGKATGWTYDNKEYLIKATVAYDVQNDAYAVVYENIDDIIFVNSFVKSEEIKEEELENKDTNQTNSHDNHTNSNINGASEVTTTTTNQHIAPDTSDHVYVFYFYGLFILSVGCACILIRKKLTRE